MENTQPNATNSISTLEVEVVPVPFSELSEQQQWWIDYNVLQGVFTEADGTMHKMSVNEFATKVGVDRTTLWRWKEKTPNFWDLVNQRRKEMFMNGARLAKVYNALFLAASVDRNVRAIQTYLANADPEFRMPNQKGEKESGGGLADILEIARGREIDTSKIIEAEIVDGPNPNPSS